MHSRLRAWLFDNNGTLRDDLHVAYPSAVNTCTTFGGPVPSLEEYRSGMTSYWQEWYYTHGVPREVTGEQMNAVRKAYFAEHGHLAHYRLGVLQVLDRCKKEGIRTGVVSAEIPGVLEACLSDAGILRYFDDVRGGAWPKPPAMVRTLVKLGVMPEDAVYVDDTDEGIASAKGLGMRTIGFINETSYHTEDRIRAAGPDEVARNFTEVERILASWF